MVVKVKKEASAKDENSPLRGVARPSDSSKSTEIEFSRLKNLLPTLSEKPGVSKLDVILEAIKYIDELQDQLLDQIQKKNLPASLLMGKENALMLLQEKKKES